MAKKSTRTDKKRANKAKARTEANKKLPGKRSFRLRKRIKRDSSDIPSAWRLLLDTYRTLVKHWRKIGGVTLIYAALYFILVRAAPEVNLAEYEELIDELGGTGSEAVKTLTLAGVAVAAAGQTGGELNTIYGLVLFVVFSLALIWTLRHLFAGKKFNIRDAYYRGMTPFVTYILMLLLIAVQLLPFALGGLLYALVQSQGIAVSGGEDLIFITLWAGLSMLSGWFVANSVMASYAVTLPGMYPWAALKASKNLVQHRRWLVLRKVLFMPLLLLALFFIFFLFWVAVVPSTALWFVDIALIVFVPLLHTYYYHLYRSLV